MRIVSIDPGTVNCGYAVWEDGKYIDFGSYNLLEMVHKKKKTDYPYIVSEFIKKTQLFHGADVVLIENQMQARMKMIACSLRCFFWGKSHMVAPLSVRKYFNISTGVYKKNKKASIELAPKYLNKEQLKIFMSHKKKDDCADAILQGLYFIKK